MLSTFDYSWTTKASDTTSRHKRRDDKEKHYGSHMAGLGRTLARSLACSLAPQPSRAAGPARPSGRGVDSRSPPSTPHLASQVFAKISRWGDICLRGFWRTIERVLVVEPDERKVCNPHGSYAAAYSQRASLLCTIMANGEVSGVHHSP